MLETSLCIPLVNYIRSRCFLFDFIVLVLSLISSSVIRKSNGFRFDFIINSSILN